VFTVSVAFCGFSFVTVTVAGTLHVGGSLAAAGVIAQLRLTAPVNPYHGVTEIVDVFPVAAPGATLIGAPVTI
jgi:phage baseplate assembly protein gpV